MGFLGEDGELCPHSASRLTSCLLAISDASNTLLSFELTDDGFKELTAKLVKELTAMGTMSVDSGIGAQGDIVACAKSLGFVPFFTDTKDLRLEALFFTATALVNARYEDLKEKEGE